MIALWVAAHYFRRPLRYIGFNGAGKQVRDFLHIDDLAELIIEQLGNWDTWRGCTLNVGGGVAHSLSLAECTALCQQITGNSIPIAADLDARSADPRIYVSDTRRALSFTDWRPARGPQKTLSDIFDWIRAEESSLRAVL